jgi:N-acetylglutamate synthase-like GNAT family acetyltransferase
MIEIIQYEPRYHEDFKRLNLQWLELFNLVESHDLEILNDPEGTVISRGGQIFLARDNNNIVGSAGIWKENDKEYELVKMGVDPAYRGQGIGKLLLQRCLDTVRNLHAEKFFLFSNSQLKTALKLYEQFGFRHVDVTNAPFKTADVKMEIVF